ncbi:hypothetical protein [Akkermansia muciniphila]|uniref:hypothetical protein n=1 Tax=Akkermansia muciniphila TaxID=239935 RepID=UPI0012BB48BF|nr:hypothetical protein [Akkermansia muciniphila]QIA36504.1 hypothetical protein GXM23_08835 [Akkermansia muciniphila]BBP48935.1 hypothetical protein AKMU_16810 [Akkermansia muciniphila]
MNQNDIAKNTIAELSNYVNAARRDLTSACANALKAGAYLHFIHVDGRITMTDALDKIGLNKSTAYRWMNAYHTACKVLGVDNPPTHKGTGWAEHLDALGTVAANMTLSRLSLGAPAAGTDLARLDAIQTGMETAENEKEEALFQNAMEKVASGEWTLLQAYRAVCGQAAQDKATERRKNPQYLGIDPKTKKPVGLLVSTISTLKQGFKNWDLFGGEEKRVFAGMWRDVENAKPDDLEQYL